MALALLGGIASQLLPAAIDWGMKKFGNTAIGRGAKGNLNKAYNKTRNLIQKPIVQKAIKAAKDVY